VGRTSVEKVCSQMVNEVADRCDLYISDITPTSPKQNTKLIRINKVRGMHKKGTSRSKGYFNFMH